MGGFGQHAIKAISKVANHCRIMGDDDASLKRKRLAQKLRFVTMKGIATQILRRNVVNPEIHTVEKLAEEVSHAISATRADVTGTDVAPPCSPSSGPGARLNRTKVRRAKTKACQTAPPAAKLLT